MRLTCPNCAATYEVDDRVIPMAGRDVQCSNCGHAWFQTPAGAESAPAPEPEADLPFEPAPDPRLSRTGTAGDPGWPDLAADLDLSGGARLSAEAEADLAAALDDTPAAAPSSDGEDWPSEDWPSEDGPSEDGSEDQTSLPQDIGAAGSETPAGMPAAGLAAAALAASRAPAEPAPRPEAELRRRSIDEAVLSVLREEAEREARARRGQQPPSLETQAELPLAQAGGPRRERPATVPADATERGAILRGEDPELEAEIAAASRPPRRELLPDIEEINSTLRATSERGREAAALDAPETLRRRRSGFRLGFGLSLGLVVVLLGIYLGAPHISARLPDAAPALAAYVDAVDRGRIWLNRVVTTRIEALTNAN